MSYFVSNTFPELESIPGFSLETASVRGLVLSCPCVLRSLITHTQTHTQEGCVCVLSLLSLTYDPDAIVRILVICRRSLEEVLIFGLRLFCSQFCLLLRWSSLLLAQGSLLLSTTAITTLKGKDDRFLTCFMLFYHIKCEMKSNFLVLCNGRNTIFAFMSVDKLNFSLTEDPPRLI